MANWVCSHGIPKARGCKDCWPLGPCTAYGLGETCIARQTPADLMCPECRAHYELKGPYGVGTPLDSESIGG